MDYNLGRVGFVLLKAYDSTRTYQPLDVVTFQGGSYAARQQTTGSPPTDDTYWMQLAERGEPGNPGSGGGTAGIQHGVTPQFSMSATAANYTVTFPVPYASKPSVQATLEIAANGVSGATNACTIRNWVQSGAQYTGVVLRANLSTGTAATCYIHWVATGTLAA